MLKRTGIRVAAAAPIFILLMVTMFWTRPDPTTRAAMCSLGFASYCPEPPPGHQFVIVPLQ